MDKDTSYEPEHKNAYVCISIKSCHNREICCKIYGQRIVKRNGVVKHFTTGGC